MGIRNAKGSPHEHWGFGPGKLSSKVATQARKVPSGPRHIGSLGIQAHVVRGLELFRPGVHPTVGLVDEKNQAKMAKSASDIQDSFSALQSTRESVDIVQEAPVVRGFDHAPKIPGVLGPESKGDGLSPTSSSLESIPLQKFLSTDFPQGGGMDSFPWGCRIAVLKAVGYQSAIDSGVPGR